MKKSFISYHQYQNTKIPIKVTLEWRNNVRISIGRKYVNLRIPALSTKTSVLRNMEWAGKWLDKQFISKPSILQSFKSKTYKTGSSIAINGQKFTIYIYRENRNSFAAKISGDEVLITIPDSLEPDEENDGIKIILSRVFAKYYYSYISNRVLELNNKHFGEAINGVRIKYNKSNWGSCSAKRNINISSRLLFAPKEVQDYVIIHELTHLKEMNHSPRFWKIVGAIIPDYKNKEKWLKENTHFCDF